MQVDFLIPIPLHWTRYAKRGYNQAHEMAKINYPIPDGKITFEKTSSVYLTGTNHTENQPVHLKLKE